jgi:hypothetical protein
MTASVGAGWQPSRIRCPKDNNLSLPPHAYGWRPNDGGHIRRNLLEEILQGPQNHSLGKASFLEKLGPQRH